MTLFPDLPARRKPETANAAKVCLDLRLGDCLELMRDLPDKSVDMVLCDLPYGMTACAWDSVIPFAPLWEQYRRVVKDRAAVVLFGTQPFTSALVMSNPDWFKYCWIWHKPNRPVGFLNAKKQPLRTTEDLCVFASGQTTYNPIMGKGKPYSCIAGNNSKLYGKHNNPLEKLRVVNNGERYPINLLTYKEKDRKVEGRIHPTQKPVALCAYLIRTYTNPGETVLDNCMGSGTTGVACARTGRNFVGMEKDPEFYRIACDRMGTKP